MNPSNSDLDTSNKLPDLNNDHLTLHTRGVMVTGANGDVADLKLAISRVDSRKFEHKGSSSPIDDVCEAP